MEETTVLYIDVELRVRHEGLTHDLAVTYVGGTAQQIADIQYLKAGKGKKIELWVDPQWRRFWVTREFPVNRIGPSIIALGLSVVGLWGLRLSFQAEEGP